MKKLISLFGLFVFIFLVAGCKTTTTTTTTTTATTGTTATTVTTATTGTTVTTATTATTSTTGTTDESYNVDTQLTGPVTITFWEAFGQDKEAILNDLIKQFNVKYPQVTVQLQSQGSYDDLETKTIQSIVAGGEPTMLIGYPDHVAAYNTANAVLPLDGFINNPVVGLSQSDLNDFVPAYLQENQMYGDGKTYGLPFNKSTEVLIYNKSYFESKICKTGFEGITSLYDTIKTSIPTGTGIDSSCLTPVKADRTPTWDQVEAAAQEIYDDTGAWGLSYDSAANLFYTLTRQWGGHYTDAKGDILFNNPQSLAAITWYQQMHDEGLFTTPTEWNDSYSSNYFISNDVYMEISSTAGMQYNVPTNGAFDIGTAPIPQKAGGTPAVIQQGTDISIMANATKQQQLAAWLLIKFLTDTSSTEQWAMQTGYLPVRISALNDSVYQQFLTNPTPAQEYNSMAEQAAFEEEYAYYYDYAFTGPTAGSSDVRSEATVLINNLLFAGYTPQQAIDTALHDLEG